MLEAKILSLIIEHYAGGDADGLDENTPLLELNIIDSSTLFDLVDLLRRETGVSIPLREVVPINFASVRAMVHMVDRLGAAKVA